MLADELAEKFEETGAELEHHEETTRLRKFRCESVNNYDATSADPQAANPSGPYPLSELRDSLELERQLHAAERLSRVPRKLGIVVKAWTQQEEEKERMEEERRVEEEKRKAEEEKKKFLQAKMQKSLIRNTSFLDDWSAQLFFNESPPGRIYRQSSSSKTGRISKGGRGGRGKK